MSDLATLEITLRQDRNLAALADSHVHRATREDSAGIIKGRDAIMAAWVMEDAAELTITADLSLPSLRAKRGNPEVPITGLPRFARNDENPIANSDCEMIAYKVDNWTGHRWVWREEGRILREVVVEDRGVLTTALPVHPSLGELRSGEGQYAASDNAILPPGFPDDARDIANWLHQAWNGRAFNLYDRKWLVELIRQLPDATFYFEHAIAAKRQTAILWRVMGHHAGGQRVRLIGSSVFTGDADETVIDHAAMAAQLERGVIDYGALVISE